MFLSALRVFWTGHAQPSTQWNASQRLTGQSASWKSKRRNSLNTKSRNSIIFTKSRTFTCPRTVFLFQIWSHYFRNSMLFYCFPKLPSPNQCLSRSVCKPHQSYDIFQSYFLEIQRSKTIYCGDAFPQKRLQLIQSKCHR